MRPPQLIDSLRLQAYTNKRRVFYFYFYEILRDSTLVTHRVGEQKFSCLQFASFAHNVASEVMETFCVVVEIQ